MLSPCATKSKTEKQTRIHDMEEVKKSEAAAAAQAVDSQAPATMVHTDYVTARHVPLPRNLKAIMKEAIDIAELSGELFFYRWETSSTSHKTGEVKKGFVIGHSVKLTNEAVRIFGNCVIHQKPVIQTPNAWIFTTAFIDLQTGFTRERQFRMDKQWPVHGRMDKFRKDDIRFQIGQSKSDRNVVLNSLPQIILERMLETAINSVRKQIEFKIKNVYGGDTQKLIDELLKAFTSYAIDQELIEKKIGLKRNKWDVNTLVMLTGDVKALKGGNETKETLYSLDETDDPHGGPKSEPDKPGLSTEQMSPGDVDKHQGYDPPNKPESAMDEPNTETIADLIERGKNVLVTVATEEMATIFATDLEAGDAFLRDCLKKKVLKDEILDNNNAGQLAQFIVLMRKQKPAGKEGEQVKAGF